MLEVWERAAVGVDVDPERRSPRYHETCLALERVEESSKAVSEERTEMCGEGGQRGGKGGMVDGDDCAFGRETMVFTQSTAMRHKRCG